MRNTYLGSKDLNSSIFDVPAELSDSPAGPAEAVSVGDDVVQVLRPPGRAVQPQRGPQELIVVAAHRGVVPLHRPHARVVLPPVPIPELQQLHTFFFF